MQIKLLFESVVLFCKLHVFERGSFQTVSQNQYKPKPAITDNNIPIKKSFVAKPIAIVENGIDRNVNSVLMLFLLT